MHQVNIIFQKSTKTRLLFLAIASMLLLSSIRATPLTMKSIQKPSETQATTAQPATDHNHQSSSPSPTTKRKSEHIIKHKQSNKQKDPSSPQKITTSDTPITALATGDTYWVDDDSQGNGSDVDPANNITWVLTNNATAGDTVNVEPGTYDDSIENFPLTLDDADVTLQSTTNASVTTIYRGGGSGVVNAIEVTADDITINGFTITCDPSTGIDLRHLSGTTITNNNIINNGGESIYMEHSNDITITNNNITNAQDWVGLYARNSSQLRIDNNNITNNNDQGIYMEQVSETNITNNHLTNSQKEEGLYARNSSQLRIDNNNITNNNDQGINIENPNLRYCLLEIQGDYGNNVNITKELNATDRLGYQPDKIQLRFNYVDIEPGDYLYLTNAAGETVNVTDVTAYTPSWTGWIQGDYAELRLETNGSGTGDGYKVDRFKFTPVRKGNNEITENHITDNNHHGIQIVHSGGNTLTDNEIAGNRDGMHLESVVDSSFANNSITGNTKDGIYIDPSEDNTIADNTIADNGDNGIELWDSTTHTITDNMIKNNTGNGIRISSSNFTTVTENNITLNNQDGVNADDVWNTSLSQNFIGCNQWYGITLINSVNNMIQNNLIQDNGNGGMYIDNIVTGGGSIAPVPESAHPYANNLNKTWTINITEDLGYRPDYVRIDMEKVDIGSGDVLYIKNAENGTVQQFEEGFSGTNFLTVWVEGGIVRFNLVTDCVGTAYGLKVESYGSNYEFISVREYNMIEGNEIKGNLGDGIYLHDTAETFIRNNDIEENTGSGIYKTMSVSLLTMSTITNNDIINNGYQGVRLYNSYFSTVSDNTITNNRDDGVKLEYPYSTTVGNNTITNCTQGFGITLLNAYNETTIQENTITKTGQDGIRLQNGNETLIADNTVTSSENNGIIITESNFTTISDNSISHGDGGGIYLEQLRNSTTVTGNTIIGNNGAGMNGANMEKIDISDNTLNNNEGGALSIDDSTYLDISDNTLNNNDNHGIALSDSVNITISMNNITENQYGISINYCGPNLTLTGNTITDHYYTGIAIRGGSYMRIGFTISNNDVRANGKDGIALYAVANGTISENTIVNNYDGIQLSTGAQKIIIRRNNIEQNYMGIDIEGNSQIEDGAVDTGLNVIRHNILRDNYHGLYIHDKFVMKPRDNLIYANDFMRNLEPVMDQAGENHFSNMTIGNYWSDYTGKDADGDGIGDTPYKIPGEGESIDHLPSMRAFTINDTTSPSLSITKPSQGKKITSKDVKVKWNGSDNIDILYYEVKLDDGSWKHAGVATNYTFKGLEDGEHTVKLKAIDAVGNTVIESITFTVNTSPIAGPGMMEETAIGVAAGAVLIGIGLFIWKRRQ